MCLNQELFYKNTLCMARFAVKTIQKHFENGYLDKRLVARIHHEVDIYQHLGASLNIAYLYGVYESDKNVEMVMEICTGGQLTSRIPKTGMREKGGQKNWLIFSGFEDLCGALEHNYALLFNFLPGILIMQLKKLFERLLKGHSSSCLF